MTHTSSVEFKKILFKILFFRIPRYSTLNLFQFLICSNFFVSWMIEPIFELNTIMMIAKKKALRSIPFLLFLYQLWTLHFLLQFFEDMNRLSTILGLSLLFFTRYTGDYTFFYQICWILLFLVLFSSKYVLTGLDIGQFV